MCVRWKQDKWNIPLVITIARMQPQLRVLYQVKLSLLLSPSKAVNCGGSEMFVNKGVGKICSCGEEPAREQSQRRGLEPAAPSKP